MIWFSFELKHSHIRIKQKSCEMLDNLNFNLALSSHRKLQMLMVIFNVGKKFSHVCTNCLCDILNASLLFPNNVALESKMITKQKKTYKER